MGWGTKPARCRGLVAIKETGDYGTFQRRMLLGDMLSTCIMYSEGYEKMGDQKEPNYYLVYGGRREVLQDIQRYFDMNVNT